MFSTEESYDFIRFSNDSCEVHRGCIPISPFLKSTNLISKLTRAFHVRFSAVGSFINTEFVSVQNNAKTYSNMHSSPSPLMHFATLAVLLHVTWLPFGADSASVGINTDKEALMSFKSQISQESPSSPLSYWNPSSSLCTWPGVICSNFGNRVIGLNLSSFGLEGTISPHIGNLSFLRSIQLQNNKLSGNLSREIGNLFRLRVLNISFNNLQGELPVNISKLTELKMLDLMANKITGRVTDDQLRNLRSLQVLNFGKNLLWGSIPPSIANLSSLNTLKFWHK